MTGLGSRAKAERTLRLAGVSAPRRDAKCWPLRVWPRCWEAVQDAASRLSGAGEASMLPVPLEHLTGVVRLRDLDLLVGAGAFVPQPETSCVVQSAVDTLRDLIAEGVPRQLCDDLCTGSGTIALSIASKAP